MVASDSRTMIAGSLSGCIAGFHPSCRVSQSSGPRRSCVGKGRLSLLLALEVAAIGRTTADRHRTVRIDGARRAFTANCSSSGWRSRSRVSPSTWSSHAGRVARDGGPSCVTTRRILPPWTCSLFQQSLSTCSMPSSSSGSTAETSPGSTSQQIRRQNGLHVK
jgi:hypothetical protein